MVRKYIKKTNKNAWTDGQMQLAIKSAMDGKSTKSAAVEFGVPRTTLQRKIQAALNNVNKTTEAPAQKVSGFKRIFTDVQEQGLCKYITEMQNNLMGLSSMEVRRLAFDYAEKLNIPHTFNQEKRLAGKDWMQKFMQRHELSYRKAEHTSTARANGFNKEAVQQFFDLLDQCLITHKIKPEDIYNVDETGVSVNPKSTSKIVAKRGIKQAGGLTAAERGETVTAELCISASGKFMPPMLIFPRVNRNEEYLAEAPPGAWAEFHKSGWIQNDIFTKWFKKFIEFSEASIEKPVLLLLDGHSSHVKNLEVIDLANKHGVIILCFPPHCTHRMQPLDVAFMKPLSHYYSEKVMEWQRLGHKVSMKNIFQLFGQAWQRAAKIETAVNAFRKTGICPFNKEIFKDSDYAVLCREPTLNKVTSPQLQKCVNVIREIHQNSSTLVESSSTSSDQQSLKQTSNAEQVLVPIQKVKEAQSLMNNLNSIFSNILNPTGDTIEQLGIPDPFEQVQETLGTSQDSIFQDVSNQNVIYPSMTDRTMEKPVCTPHKIKIRAKGQAAIITDESYKENLVAQKLRSIKKEPKDPAAKKSTAKPKIKSDFLIKQAPLPKPSRKRKTDQSDIPEVLQKKVLTDSQNIQLPEIVILQSDDGSTYQVLDNNNYSALFNNYPNYQLDMTSNNNFNIQNITVPELPQQLIYS